MPLNKPEKYDIRFIGYELKRAIVEHKCKGCQYLIRVPDADDDDLLTSYGCTYENDLRGINTNLREPYITLLEIAHNTCQFWFGEITGESAEPDSRPEGVAEYT